VDNTGKGFFDGGTQTGGADFAESVAVRGQRSLYEPGDLLVIDASGNRRLALARDPYSARWWARLWSRCPRGTASFRCWSRCSRYRRGLPVPPLFYRRASAAGAVCRNEPGLPSHPVGCFVPATSMNTAASMSMAPVPGGIGRRENYHDRRRSVDPPRRPCPGRLAQPHAVGVTGHCNRQFGYPAARRSGTMDTRASLRRNTSSRHCSRPTRRSRSWKAGVPRRPSSSGAVSTKSALPSSSRNA
jgi:hypothetical protein